MTRMLCLTVVVSVLALTGCFSTSPAYTVDMETEPVTLCKSVGAEKVKASIVNAAVNRQWSVIKEEDGRVDLLLDVRGKHEARVSVNYTADSFCVKYISSVNLNYDQSTKGIHRKYIQWVRNLKADIRRLAQSN